MTAPRYLPAPGRQVPPVLVPPLADLDVAPASRWLVPVIVVRPFVVAAAAVALGATGYPILALALLPVLFASGLCTIHCAVHGSLRLPPQLNHLLLTLTSLLLFESGHSMVETHERHHRAEPGEEDPESYIETLSWGRLALEAPRYRYRLWAWAARHGLRSPLLTALEVAWNGASLVVAVLALGRAPWLSMLITGVHVGNAVFVVAAARGPHTNYGQPITSPFVTVRGRITPWLLAGHAWHVEHHLYPEVPLPGLRRMIPAIDPILCALGTHEVKVP